MTWRSEERQTVAESGGEPVALHLAIGERREGVPRKGGRGGGADRQDALGGDTRDAREPVVGYVGTQPSVLDNERR